MGELTTVAVSMFMRCEGRSCGASNELRAIVDRYRCRSCLRVQVISPERWRDLLDTAVQDVPRMKPGTEIERDLEDRAPGRVVAKNVSATCASCAAPVSLDAIARGRSGGHCPCVVCGVKLLVRPTPREYTAMLPGITHLLGEDIGVIANPEPPLVQAGEEVAALCPACGGGLTVDGTSRAVRCKYCSNMVVLPRSLWVHLRPHDDSMHTFYLLHDESVPGSALRASVAWSNLHSVAGDARGNLYGIAEDRDVVYDPRVVVFSLDALGRTRWVRRDLLSIATAMLAWRRDGTLLVARKNESVALLLRDADGNDAGTLGTEQPRASSAHTLDLNGARAVAVDIDDSVIFVKQNRLVRGAADGTAAPMWPPHKALFGFMTVLSKTPPFTEKEVTVPPFKDIGDYPAIVPDADISVGWDGSLYLWSSSEVASFDRTGKRRWLASLPVDVYDLVGDENGTAYVRCDAEKSTSLFRVSTHGAVDRIAGCAELLSGGLIGRRDGTLVALGGYGRVIVFAANGAVLSEHGADPDEDDDDD